MAEFLSSSLILVDAHVHLHRCFAVEQVLSSACEHFTAIASRWGHTGDLYGCLLLTEMAGESWFLEQRATVQQQGSVSLGPWTLKASQETESLVVWQPVAPPLVLLAGRQVVTQEGLEVLALITAAQIADGQSLSATVAAITAVGGLPVLPWGAGKWLGRRGQLLASFLQSTAGSTVYLGDNRGRPWGWRQPPYFRQVEAQGRPVLPGTDPLPLPSEATRVGSFGLALPGPLDLNQPAATLRARFMAAAPQVRPYGRLERPWRFLTNQVALRLRSAA